MACTRSPGTSRDGVQRRKKVISDALLSIIITPHPPARPGRRRRVIALAVVACGSGTPTSPASRTARPTASASTPAPSPPTPAPSASTPLPARAWRVAAAATRPGHHVPDVHRQRVDRPPDADPRHRYTAPAPAPAATRASPSATRQRPVPGADSRPGPHPGWPRTTRSPSGPARRCWSSASPTPPTTRPPTPGTRSRRTTARSARSGVWTGHQAILWGGGCCGGVTNAGAAYTPADEHLARAPAVAAQPAAHHRRVDRQGSDHRGWLPAGLHAPRGP